MQNTFSLQKTLICLYHSRSNAAVLIYMKFFIRSVSYRASHTKENSFQCGQSVDINLVFVFYFLAAWFGFENVFMQL